MNKFLREHLLYEDESFVFINKPPGLLSISDRFDSQKPHLFGLLRKSYDEIYPVHRIDQNTSGVMVFARTKVVQRELSGLFESREVDKQYSALCTNTPQTKNGVIEEPIKENHAKRGTYVVSNLGKKATTHYDVITNWSLYSLLKIKILTGRTHQIRVHLAYIGCPLIVDSVYGFLSEFYLSSIKKKRVNIRKGESERPLLSRTPLHAHSISFVFGEDKKRYDVTCELPKDMRAMCYQLNKRYPAEPTNVDGIN